MSTVAMAVTMRDTTIGHGPSFAEASFLAPPGRAKAR